MEYKQWESHYKLKKIKEGNGPGHFPKRYNYRLVAPPSIANMVPVQNDDSSLAK